MKRKIVNINEEKCNGCGLCIDACHEGALVLENGKAKLISDSYCDGLGDCLPECPVGAIEIIEREADEFDEEAVQKRIKERTEKKVFQGCPGSRVMNLNKDTNSTTTPPTISENTQQMTSHLGQWPCQLKLVPVNAPFFDNARLLIAADCTAFAYANIHNDFMKNKVTLIGCPKLDDTDYSEKLAAIFSRNNIKSVQILRMEVPCCGGLVQAVINAFNKSKKMIPWNVVTIGTDGVIREE